MASRKNLRLASFDGGGIRGFSQLEIMTRIMHRLNWGRSLDQRMLPCACFDLMGGSGTGGLITILLAKLHMSVEEASQEFDTIMEEMYKQKNSIPLERTRGLRQCMEEVMKRKGLPLDMRLVDDMQDQGCASFVVTSFRTNAKSTVCLRSYPIRSEPSSSITVIDAVLATCATQPEFLPVISGSGFRKREYIAATGATNPIYEMITEAHELFGQDACVTSLLSLGAGNPGIVSFPLVTEDADMYRMMRNLMHDCEQRAQEFNQRIGQEGIYSRFSVEQGLQNDNLGLVNDPGWIVTQTEQYLNQYETSEKLDLLVQNHGTPSGSVTMNQLRHVGGSHAPRQLQSSVERSTGILISNQDDAIIEKLKPTDLEYGSHIPECMEGTRRDILAEIDAWAVDFDAPNILWIHGHPGVGKSAIATSIVEKWRSSGRLGSSFFFQRERANAMTPRSLWCTIAYDLGRRHTAIRKHLVTTLTTNKTLTSTSNIDLLFRQLIHEPLTASEGIPPDECPVVILDALDECGGLDRQYSDHRKGLLRTVKSWSTLPGKFKIVITSRNESDIERLFSTILHHSINIPAGQQVNAVSSEDIYAFLKYELEQIVTRSRSLPRGWPGEKTIAQLSDRAAGLFIWVKTVINLLERREPQRTLKQILEAGGASGMASLYTWILNASFPLPGEEDINDFQSILGAIIFSKASFNIKSLACLLSIERSAIEHICNGLHSVLDSRDTLRINHQSFVDFLLDSKDCPPHFLIDRERENRRLTEACLETMKNHLRFNICGLKSSYLRNSEVTDLASRIDQHIPTFLLYSSSFWAGHLAEINFDNDILEKLQYFMRNRFLFWLEVLSLTGIVNVASSMLWALLHWIQTSSKDYSMAKDMQKFVAGFASVISQSAPHIYLSALPFSPSNLPVSENYLEHYPQTIGIRCGGRVNQWPALQSVLSGHTGAVCSIICSLDGKYIISGSKDKMIRVWDAETGETALSPLKGHTGWVNAVSVSRDGRYVVSGSNDKGIRIWDATTGMMAIGPLEGHENWVTSVSFSPDDRRVVSGSLDATIRVWDTKTGETMVGPWKGHTGGISFVAFSPDGIRIVSGSLDGVIRVWDAETGVMVVGPLEGHNNGITAVLFSPNGRHIASSSLDKMIRLWNAETGQMLMGPWEGHTMGGGSVSFSPDSRRIVSGSADQKIRIWDVGTGQMVVGPLEGHKSGITTASYFPGGKRIVSGSFDKTIRIWDAEASQTLTPIIPLTGHKSTVSSVAFSPDGRRIVSGSRDNSIRVWDAHTGQSVAGPLREHTGSVVFVSFSPDGRHIVSGSNDQTIRVWDVDTGQTVIGPLEVYALANSVAFSPDGRLIASSLSKSRILVWDARTGQTLVKALEGHDIGVSSVSFSPDGSRIVTGSYDKIRVEDAQTDQSVVGLLRGRTKPVNSVALSPDGRCVASGSDTIRILDVQTGQILLGPLEGHSGNVNSVAFSPDGRRIVSGSDDKSILVWDTQTGQTVVGPLEGHTGAVSSVSFSPDGRYIVSGSKDTTIRVWDIEESTSNIPTFRDSSRIQDGWILGPNSELLFWVPFDLRTRLCPLRNTLVIGGDVTQLDLKNFVHGEAWIHCKNKPVSVSEL